MNLAEGSGRQALSGEFVEKAPVIFFHALAAVGFGKPQIKPRAWSLTHAALASAESVH